MMNLRMSVTTRAENCLSYDSLSSSRTNVLSEFHARTSSDD
jgi:hypothetical protein